MNPVAPRPWRPIQILCPCGVRWTTSLSDPQGVGGTHGSRNCPACRAKTRQEYRSTHTSRAGEPKGGA